MLKIIEKQYSQISKSYIGHISELVVNIKELENYYRKGSNAYLMEAHPNSIVMHKLHKKSDEDEGILQ
jgi:hypothetical protein